MSSRQGGRNSRHSRRFSDRRRAAWPSRPARLGDVAMLRRQLRQLRIGFDRRDACFERLELVASSLELASAVRSALAAFLSAALHRRRAAADRVGSSACARRLLAQLRQPPSTFVIVDQLVDQPVQPGQFFDRVAPVGLVVEEVLVAVDDHAELRAPVADVVVADHAVAEESQRAATSASPITVERMWPDVHRLGHVGGRVVDHEGPRLRDRRRRPAADRRPRPASRGGQPLGLEPQVDEAGPGDLGRLAQVGRRRAGRRLRRPRRAAAGRAACPAAWPSWPGSRRTSGPGSAAPRSNRSAASARHSGRCQPECVRAVENRCRKLAEDIHATISGLKSRRFV